MGKYNYLVCVDTDKNNYKFYEMKEHEPADGFFTATWGRVGSGKKQTKDYPMSRYESIYVRKTNSRNYADQTMYYAQQAQPVQSVQSAQANSVDKDAKDKVRTATKKNISDEQFDLWAFLSKFTNKAIKQVYENGDIITRAMVDETEKRIRDLYIPNIGVSQFNGILLNIMALCPRRVASRRNGQGGLHDWMAQSPDDFPSIRAREESLLQAMRSKVSYVQSSINSSGHEAGYISEKVKLATDRQVDIVMKHLPSHLRKKVCKVYRIIPDKKSKEYKRYCDDRGITRKRLYWHGSRNENWLSIIETSLSLNPNAKITGKMFGNGIYFAPDADKSWNYTSRNGSYWAHGSSEYGIMGLYETAYGRPLDVTTAGHFNQRWLESNGYNCVHAHKGHSLYRDEVIFYHEDAMCLQYLVIFKA